MSPAKNGIDPTSRRSRLKLYFASNPGQHSAKDVATTLGDDPMKVQNECARMARDGQLTRTQVSPPAVGQPRGISTYSAPQDPAESAGVSIPAPPTEPTTED